MGDKKRGLYDKFSKIERTDKTDLPGGKHYGCRYFVIDLTHDEFAISALAAYSVACDFKYPILAKDLRAKILKMRGLRE